MSIKLSIKEEALERGDQPQLNVTYMTPKIIFDFAVNLIFSIISYHDRKEIIGLLEVLDSHDSTSLDILTLVFDLFSREKVSSM